MARRQHAAALLQKAAQSLSDGGDLTATCLDLQQRLGQLLIQLQQLEADMPEECTPVCLTDLQAKLDADDRRAAIGRGENPDQHRSGD